MCRARRLKDGVATSNIVWSYAHTTVPRHHRDIFVTEYGIADTRGKPDSDVVEALAGIADSEFQDELVDAAKRAGKLVRGYTTQADACENSPGAIAAVFAHNDLSAHFPPYPLGTDFTEPEQALIDALEWLDGRTATPLPRWRTTVAALLQARPLQFSEELARMDLATARGIKSRVLRRLVAHALGQTRSQRPAISS
jgi:hypothetical protein